MGALTSKLYSFQSRPWELRRERGIDPYEGEDVLFELRGLEVLRILPQQGWVSDKIRIVVDSFHRNRLLVPKKFIYQKEILSERSVVHLVRVLSFLFPKKRWERRKSKRNFYFPFFFDIFQDRNLISFGKGKKRWNYIIC